ncbi:benzyl alcohol O-benzoyltransferase-like [Prosopis cineraria]|uniref:benzyl alcohol O-benzoyltransferase-like n=1 Tax=Prosopis cineraria TaxID=364024 RepID=UPI00240EAE05|nr:benzyl alcohol O-benzoyltransferase-like [Prosopis cineraria]
MAPSALSFTVRRRQPELIAPAKATPREVKLLSDIDDQEGLRFQIPVIQFYRYDAFMRGKDPVVVIRKALAETLVLYYPFAGRLREGPNRKLMVDCNGDGVVFIEADADLTLEAFGDSLQPPFPCLEELLYDVPGTSAVLNTPLLLIQVTRLKCGGFIFALRLNHAMSDASGLVQFMTALGEIACGAREPSIPPVWQRELLNARDPPRVTCTHREYDEVPDTKGTIIPLDDMVHRSFFFGPNEVASIRSQIPYHLRQSSDFEIITAFLWRCRTMALQPDDDEEVRIICIVNARAKFNPPLPAGYYGNGFAFPVAVTTAGELCRNPLGYALELVKKAKGDVTEEYMHSLADLLVIKGRPHFTVVRSYLVSDVTRAGFGNVDFGWGKAAYGGPAKGGVGAIPGVASFYIPFKNAQGQEGLVIPVCLPGEAMERFVKELDSTVKNYPQNPRLFITSSL